MPEVEIILVGDSEQIQNVEGYKKLDNVSVSFNKNDSYGYIGSSKDITKLDQTSNVDNKVKSGIFNDYLYYAGSSTTGNAQTPHFISDDGSVTLKGRLAPMENAGV